MRIMNLFLIQVILFGDIEVYVLRVSHDATNPIGFIFSGDETLLYMTDTGYVSQKNKELIHNLNYYIIEIESWYRDVDGYTSSLFSKE